MNRAAPQDPREALLTQARLEAGLWSAAQALRGAIDAADYRGVILGAVFLKRLSDVADEGDVTFTVPPAARWNELRARTSGVGEAMQRACVLVERANPSLAGVLTAASFDGDHRLGPRRQRDQALRAMLDALNPLPLGRRALADPDVLGRAYEYLLARFADDAGRRGGEFYTPPGVVRLLVSILDPRPGMRVCDPTCGSAGMLVAVAEHLRAAGHQGAAVALDGQEKNAATWAIARMNLVLHGLSDARVELGDTLRAPKLLQDKGLRRYDRVIANPPFSLRGWGREAAAADPWARFGYGLPPEGRGDLAFVQHMLATLNEGGVLAVVLPQGALFRGGGEAAIRAGLLRDGLVEAVVALPDGLFHGTPIPASVLVLRRGRGRDEGTRMVDARALFAPGVRQNALRDSDIERILGALRGRGDEPGLARAVCRDALLEAGAVLSPARWVGAAPAVATPSWREALAALAESAGARDAAEAELRALLARRG